MHTRAPSSDDQNDQTRARFEWCEVTDALGLSAPTGGERRRTLAAQAKVRWADERDSGRRRREVGAKDGTHPTLLRRGTGEQ
jgi:hypothetical protein